MQAQPTLGTVQYPYLTYGLWVSEPLFITILRHQWAPKISADMSWREVSVVRIVVVVLTGLSTVGCGVADCMLLMDRRLLCVLP